jgi:hypothetical protein
MGYGGCSSALAARQYLTVRVRHYEDLDQVRWHVQTQIAAAGDPDFAAPLIDLDSSVDATGWHVRPDGHGEDGQLTPLDAQGAMTQLASAREEGRAATLYYLLADAQRRLLRRSRSYWQRSRQSADGGETWTDWMTEPLEVE